MKEYKLVSPDGLSPKDVAESGKQVVPLNLNHVAAACNCSSEQVCSFLNRVRDLVISNCLKHSKNVSLNMGIGSLNFGTNKQVEFKSHSITDMLDTFYQYEKVQDKKRDKSPGKNTSVNRGPE